MNFESPQSCLRIILAGFFILIGPFASAEPNKIQGVVLIEAESASFSCLGRWEAPPTYNRDDALLFGDFDGDGRQDIAGGSKSGIVWLLRSNHGGQDVLQKVSDESPDDSNFRYAAADLDGDGFEDLLRWAPSVVCPAISLGSKLGLRPFTENSSWCNLPQKFDGLFAGRFFDIRQTNLLFVKQTPAAQLLEYFELHGLSEAPSQGLRLDMKPPSATILLADVNGDHLLEVIRENPLEPGFVADIISHGPTTWISLPKGRWRRPIVGDLNGDGRSDLVLYDERFRSTILARSIGTTGLEQTVTYDTCMGVPLFAFDFNRNGRDELVLYDVQGAYQLAELRMSLPSKPFVVAAHTGEPVHLSGENSFEVSLPENQLNALYGAGPEYVFRIGGRQILPQTGKPHFFSLPGSIIQKSRVGNAYTLAGPAELPYLCNGLNAGLGYSGIKWGRVASLCPPGAGMVEVEDYSEEINASSRRTLLGLCCPFSEANTLTTKRVYTDLDCPPGFVILGTDPNRMAEGESERFVCGEIDSTRFTLGNPRSGTYWGMGWSGRRENKRVSKAELPAWLRHGAGRVSFLRWDADGCIGSFPGGFLTGLSKSDCSGYKFQTVLPRETPASNSLPDAVHCSSDPDPFSPLAGCEKGHE